MSEGGAMALADDSEREAISPATVQGSGNDSGNGSGHDVVQFETAKILAFPGHLDPGSRSEAVDAPSIPEARLLATGPDEKPPYPPSVPVLAAAVATASPVQSEL